jgi:hypothetical protein
MTTEQFQLTNEALRTATNDAIDNDAAALNYGYEAQDLQAAQDQWDAAQSQDINNAVDPETGKPAFSNAEKRAAELAIRQTNDDESQKRAETIEALKRKAAAQRILADRKRAEATYLRNEVAYAVAHPADELALELQALKHSIQTVVDTAAAAAVRRTLAELAGTSSG